MLKVHCEAAFTAAYRYDVLAGPLLYWRPAGALVAFPVIAYGFTTHHFLFVVYASLKSPTVTRMTLVAQKVSSPSQIPDITVVFLWHVCQHLGCLQVLKCIMIKLQCNLLMVSVHTAQKSSLDCRHITCVATPE